MHRKLQATSVLAVALLAGCGLEAVDTRMQARAEVAQGMPRLEVAEGELRCPGFIVNADSPFGPYHPCLAPVEPDNTCDRCGLSYTTSAEGGEGRPVAVPMLRCPHCQEAIEPGQLIDNNGEASLGANTCPHCNRYFEAAPADGVVALANPDEIICPGCRQPIDPTMNMCANTGCTLGGVVRNLSAFDGPCWRCGALYLCPECDGSGVGTMNVFGDTPADCWYCLGTGRCPECDEGFATYEGSLPPAFRQYTTEGSLPSARRNWRFTSPEAATDGPSDDRESNPERQE